MPSPSPVPILGLSFQYSSAARPLFDQLNLHLLPGFTGVVGANGTGKTTLLHLVSGELVPDEGQVLLPDNPVYCAQRTDVPPEDFEDFLFDDDPATYALQAKLNVDASFVSRWDSLSHGERKRAQIACALWNKPDLLALDEPTNHLDGDARAMLTQALQRFEGIGVLVSHDRELLDELCRQCLWLDEGGATLYEGGYTKAAAQRALEQLTAGREQHQAKQEATRLRQALNQRRDKAANADRQRSKRGIPRGDHDAKAKIDAARVSGKDGQAGRLQQQLSGRLTQAQDRADVTKLEKQYETGIWLDSAPSPTPHVLHVDADEVSLSDTRRLRFPTLDILRADRIALTGANGSGKSTLTKQLVAQLTLSSERLIYLPQEISAEEGRAILKAVKALDREGLGQVMTIVSRLGSRPNRLLESTTPSPGELRKLMLALGMVRRPYLIVMDEPTNHLDLPSITALESALANCPCALLLVSHDQRLLDNLCTVRWQIAQRNVELAELEIGL